MKYYSPNTTIAFMKQKILFVLFLIMFTTLSAQDYYKQGSFVIKGKIKNSSSELIEYGVTGYLSSYRSSLVINNDGSFEQQLPIQHRQQFAISISDSFPVFISAQNGDTITLNWDKKDIKRSLVIKGTTEARSTELQIQMNLDVEYIPKIKDLMEQIIKKRKTLTAEEKFNLINKQFNQHIKAIVEKNKSITSGLSYYIIGLYFRYSDCLHLLGLIPKFELRWDIDDYGIFLLLNNTPPMSITYKKLDENWFWNVGEYRDFIYNYVRDFKAFDSYSLDTNFELTPYNTSLDEYNRAIANINLVNIKEWFITTSILIGFERYEFDDVEKTYNQFINNCTVPYLKDTLQQYYAAIKRLKPGNPAPAFTLKNEKGEKISLSDLKGKVVYLDFWGVYCGPCIAEIEGHVPALHERYKNEKVAFVYICVDTKEPIWKKALYKYPLKGINLVAEGWANNPVCKDYNVSGIPHYVLIDKNGKIVDKHAPAPSMLDLKSGNNPIDVLLK